jgi:CTP-dependent riboflavin kinase
MTKYREFKPEDIRIINIGGNIAFDFGSLYEKMYISPEFTGFNIPGRIIEALGELTWSPFGSEDELKYLISRKLNEKFYPGMLGVKMEETTEPFSIFDQLGDVLKAEAENQEKEEDSVFLEQLIDKYGVSFRKAKTVLDEGVQYQSTLLELLETAYLRGQEDAKAMDKPKLKDYPLPFK